MAVKKTVLPKKTKPIIKYNTARPAPIVKAPKVGPSNRKTGY